MPKKMRLSLSIIVTIVCCFFSFSVSAAQNETQTYSSIGFLAAEEDEQPNTVAPSPDLTAPPQAKPSYSVKGNLPKLGGTTNHFLLILGILWLLPFLLFILLKNPKKEVC